MKRIINRMSYDTETAEEVATNKYWDGSNWDRNGRTTTLMRTKKGRFFLYTTTRWQGERDLIEPLDEEQAMAEYENLPEQSMAYAEAFGEEPEEA